MICSSVATIDDDGRQEHRRLVDADDAARDDEAEVLGGEAGGGVGVASRRP